MTTTAAPPHDYRRQDEISSDFDSPVHEGRVIEVLVAAAVAICCFLVMRGALRLDAAPDSLLSPTLQGLAAPWALGVLALAAAGYVVAGWRYARVITAAFAGVAAWLMAVPLTLGLLGTDQPMNGVLDGDNTFHTEYVTRFASSWKLQDYMFAGEDAFYPPAWFWVVGRWAAAAGTDPWRMIQPASILTQTLALVIAFALWRLTTRPPTALAAAIASSAMISGFAADVGPAWYSPYSAFVAVVLVPWCVAAHAYLVGPRATPGRITVLMGMGALLALSYYLLFVIGMVALAVSLLPATARRQVPAGRRLLLLTTGVAVLTAVFWVPFTADLLAGTATQGMFFHPEFLEVSTGFQAGPASAMITVTAAVLLLLTFRAPVSRALIALGVSTILYQVVSAFTLAVVHQQLQPQRAATLLASTIAAAVPVAVEVITTTKGPLREGVSIADFGKRIRITVAALVCLPVLSVMSASAVPLFASDLVKKAHPSLDHAVPDALHSTIVEAVGAPAEDLVVASADLGVLALYPFWGFLPWNVHYAHPHARLTERVAFLQRAAACPDAACFDKAMAASPFGPVDSFVLRKDPTTGALQLSTQLPRFPDPEHVTITFDRDLFKQGWIHRDVAGYAVYVSDRRR